MRADADVHSYRSVRKRRVEHWAHCHLPSEHQTRGTMRYADHASEQTHLSTLTREFDSSVFGDDAPSVWSEHVGLPSVDFPSPGIAVISGHEAGGAVMRQPNLYSSGPKALYFGSDTGAIPLQIDPPHHTPYRKVLDLLFAPKRVAEKEPELVALANDLIDGFIQRGEVD